MDYCYIYMIKIFGIEPKCKKIYFIDSKETYPYFDMDNAKIYYIRVPKTSNKYLLAYYTSQSNNYLNSY